MNSYPREFKPSRILRKFFVTGFVIFTFGAYALHEHLVNPNGTSGDAPIGNSTTTQVLDLPHVTPTRFLRATPTPSAPRGTTRAAIPTQVLPTDVPPTDAPLPTNLPIAQRQYKDGVYMGNQVDVVYGYVRVKATVQNGKIADVTFLEFPQDRRTSQRINAVAVPYLQQEAMQAQSANVDIISGATLTSEGFIQSLQVALASAKS